MKNRQKGIRILVVFALISAMMLSVLSLSACSVESSTSFTVFYTTDTHGHVVSDDDTIGLEYVAALKSSTKNSLLLDAGDFLHGLPVATVDKGKKIVEFMRDAGYDGAALGNHEFNYSIDILQQRIAEAKGADNKGMSMISANVYDADGDRLFTPYFTKTVNTIKVGVFALTTPSAKITGTPSIVSDLDFKDPLAEAEKVIGEMKSENCDFIIALCHLGSDEGTEVKGEDIAGVAGVGLVIDGHSHITVDKTVGGVKVVSSGEYGENIGKLDISLKQDKSVKEIDNVLIAKNDDLLKKIKDADSAVDGTKLAETDTTLYGEKALVRSRETNFGNLIADSYKWKLQTDVAVVNGGGIRASVKAGDITVRDALTVFPYGNCVVKQTIKGSTLLEVLEKSIEQRGWGGFLQLSEGLEVIVAEDNTISIKLNGEAIDGTKDYTIALNNYMAEGGDGYDMLKDIPYVSSELGEDDVFVGYIEYLNSFEGGKVSTKYSVSPAQRIIFESQRIIAVSDQLPVEDASFNQLTFDALKTYSDHSITAKVKESGSYSAFLNSLTEDVNNYPDVVWSVNSIGASDIFEIAKSNPYITFVVNDTAFDGEGRPDNLITIEYSTSQAAFLAGYIAAVKSQTKVVGFVGGMDIAVINDIENGFAAGVNYAKANIAGCENVQLKTEYTGTFDGSTEGAAKGKAAAETLIGGGADVIFHAAGACGNSVIAECKSSQIWAIGVDYDQSALAPDYMLTSVIKNVGAMTKKVFDDILKGEADAEYTAKLVSGVGLAAKGSALSQDIYDEAESLAESIKDGTLDINDWYISD